MRRTVLVLTLAGVLSAAGAVGVVRDEAPTAATGARADTRAAVTSAWTGLAGADLDAAVAALQTRLERLPGDHPAWAALALAHVEQARTSGDPTLYDRAEAAVERSLSLAPQDNAAALAARAALLAARHDFSAALRDAQAALRTNPYEATALAVRVDALTELGRYDEQLRALAQADRRRPGVPVVARYAYAQELRGDLDEAARTLRTSLTSATGPDRTFVLVALADVERKRGRLASADDLLQEADRATPGHVPTSVSRARLAVARGDLDEAVAHWERVVERTPLAEHLTELGELHLLRGDESAAQTQFDVVRATNQLAESAGVDVDLESALFEADHGDPATAVAAARAEWDRRRSVQVADAYGWSLHRAGRPAAALPLLRSATRLGTADARTWVHRGLVEAALGRDGDARRSLRRGLGLDPGFAPWQAAEARRVLRALTSGRAGEEGRR